MKRLLQLFNKKTPSQNSNSETPTASVSGGGIQHNLGQSSQEFLPQSKLPIILSVFLLVAVCVLGYRFLTSRSGDSALQEMSAPKPIFASKLAANTVNQDDPVAKARRLFENRQIDDSIAIYEKLIQTSPADAEAMNDMGVLYLKKQKLKESETHLKRSIELAPECVVCLNNLGYLKTLQGQEAEAENYFKKAISLNGDYVDPYFNLGVLYEKSGDLARSVGAYQEFLNRSKDPSSPFNLKLKQHLNSLLEK